VLELCRGNLPGLNWFYFVYNMPSGFVLRHHGSVCCDRRLCSGLVLRRVCNNLFELSSGIIFVICIIIELLELSCGVLSGLNRIDDMYGMPWRIILHLYWPVVGEWTMFSG